MRLVQMQTPLTDMRAKDTAPAIIRTTIAQVTLVAISARHLIGRVEIEANTLGHPIAAPAFVTAISVLDTNLRIAIAVQTSASHLIDPVEIAANTLGRPIAAPTLVTKTSVLDANLRVATTAQTSVPHLIDPVENTANTMAHLIAAPDLVTVTSVLDANSQVATTAQTSAPHLIDPVENTANTMGRPIVAPALVTVISGHRLVVLTEMTTHGHCIGDLIVNATTAASAHRLASHAENMMVMERPDDQPEKNRSSQFGTPETGHRSRLMKRLYCCGVILLCGMRNWHWKRLSTTDTHGAGFARNPIRRRTNQ